MTEQQLYSAASIRQLEALYYKHSAVAPYELMQKAGLTAFKLLQKRWPKLQQLRVFCGGGNNAGDGYVLARLAHEAGINVQVYALGQTHRLPEPASLAYKACKAAGTRITPYPQEQHAAEQDDSTVIVDALCGIGLQGKVKASYAHAIQAINQFAKPVLALDIPSGLDADTGRVQGVAVQATITLSFIALKQGLYLADAFDYCGEILCDDLGLLASLQSRLFASVQPSATLMPTLNAQQILPKRKRNVHKGLFGHVLVIGGDHGMGGAVRLAGEAAARMGAGWVTLATRSLHVAAILAARPELLCYGIESSQELKPLIERASVLAIGPGLGQTDWGRGLLQRVLASSKPKLLDADALNLLVGTSIPLNNAVITPHPGEAARLLQTTTELVQANRMAAAKELQHKFGAVVVLKGAGTLIVAEKQAYICSAGNPGMASAGMGDVLSGMIGGLLAQGLTCKDAACIAVQLHAQAGDCVAKAQGEQGMLALDLLSALKYAP